MKNKRLALVLSLTVLLGAMVSFETAQARGGFGGGGFHPGGGFGGIERGVGVRDPGMDVPRDIEAERGYGGDREQGVGTRDPGMNEPRDIRAEGGFGDRGYGGDLERGVGERDSGGFNRPRQDDAQAWANEVWNQSGGSRLATDGGFGVMNYAGLAATGPSRTGGFPTYKSANFQSFARRGNYTQKVSPTDLANYGNSVRGSFNHYDAFGRNWWNGYHRGWYYPWMDGYAWGWTPWADLAGFWGVPADDDPDYYDYGNNYTYNNDEVYYNSQPLATAPQFYTQSLDLAQSGNTSPASTTTQSSDDLDFGPQGLQQPTVAPKKDDWKPLGVFSLTQGKQTDPTTMFQLLVNKDGIIRGNYYNALTNTVEAVTGAVDKKKMRASWTVSNNQTVVYDTGVANLLKPQSPILVHFGKDNTQQWTLVRLEQPSTPTTPAAPTKG